jgi:uncharacterized OsmC-like protein
MEHIRVDHVSGHQFSVQIRDHSLTVDQPESAGGGDAGPTPTELFVAGLVACVAHYARAYLARHGIDAAGLAVTADWAMADDRPARVGQVTIGIEAPAGLPPERYDALLAVASHCTVHNSLTTPPAVTIGLSAGVAA